MAGQADLLKQQINSEQNDHCLEAKYLVRSMEMVISLIPNAPTCRAQEITRREKY
jgi:hypothetical protein